MSLNQEAIFEKKKWNEYFSHALAGQGQEHETSLWWQISDDDSVSIIKKYLNKKSIDVLESGCGSGGSSFYLSAYLTISSLTLCDISENALRFARSLQPGLLEGRVNYINAEITNMPFPDNSFDLNWNVGVVEHYPKEYIYKIVAEMNRVTKQGGYVIISIPNRNSVATLKAWLLGSKFGRKYLKFIPGYRFDSEILYGNGELKKFLSEKMQKEVFIEYGGNLLWVGAPHWLVKKTNSWFPGSRFSFLTFYIFKK